VVTCTQRIHTVWCPTKKRKMEWLAASVLSQYQYQLNRPAIRIWNTARPWWIIELPNRGHFGTAAFVLSSEVVLFSEVV